MVRRPGRARKVRRSGFLDACERLGDTAILRVADDAGAAERIEGLEQALLVMTDHEILHQQLAVACKAAG